MKKLLHTFFFTAISSSFLISSAAAVPSEPTANDKSTEINGFIKAEGTLLVDGNGNPFLIKGIAFGNDVWSNPTKAPRKHHTEENYKELNELGFNSIRFYLNYKLFEKDSDPYNYDFKGVDGWDWLDWNIEMAKKYNIRLVLNMHVPQGGFQSGGDGMTLWTDKKNQQRLIGLWTEIARRYKDETAIAAFDLLNEPIVPELATLEKSFAQWENLAQEIAYAIRTVNENHVIIVERLNAIKNIKTGATNWTADMNGNMNYFLIDDPNVAYQFHNYDPFRFTHQNAGWVESVKGVFTSYPDENAIEAVGNQPWEGAVFDNPRLNNSRTAWQEMKGVLYKANNKKYKTGIPAVQVSNIGSEGKVYIDEIIINEYDENKRFVRTVASYDFSTRHTWNFWSANGSGKVEHNAAEGRSEKGCLTVSGTTSDANTSDGNVIFPVRQGYHYEISGWLKGEHINTDANITLRIDFLGADEIHRFNKEYLEKSITRYLQFGTDHNVPIYLGEFGVIAYGFEQNRGGERWVKDMLEICKRYNINFNYHTFHEEAFGLYRNNASEYPDKLNTVLYETFMEALRD